MNPDQTPISHQCPANSTLEDKFKDFFPEEFRDLSPQDDTTDANKVLAPSSQTTMATRSSPVLQKTNADNGTPVFTPAKHCMVDFTPTVSMTKPNGSSASTPPPQTTTKVDDHPHGSQKVIDILQQLLGSQEETLQEAHSEKPIGNHGKCASPIPPELEL
ncbi:hypothetical protein TNCV_4346681 [Trichonephila clavipes]|nr:hypothetical protein TNCV_4346681 [Trichonephila clavipes]